MPETAQRSVFALHIAFSGGATTSTKYVRAGSRQRAKWWARETFENGVVRWVSRRDADSTDEEIEDIGGWEDD